MAKHPTVRPEPSDPTDALGPDELARLYSPDEADALVPHLEAAFDTIAHLRRQLTAYVRELETLGIDLGEPIPPELLARPEVEALVSRALKEHGLIREQLAALEAMGVEVKALDGLCDVRSRHDGRVVYLCWRQGEPGFNHWHELDTGFDGRQRVLRRGEFEGTLLH